MSNMLYLTNVVNCTQNKFVHTWGEFHTTGVIMSDIQALKDFIRAKLHLYVIDDYACLSLSIKYIYIANL